MVSHRKPITRFCPLLNLNVGGGSGIGFAAAKIFAAKNAKKILILDVNPALEPLPSNAEHLKCNIASWHELLNAFEHAGTVDIACANAGVGGESDFLADAFDDNGVLQEPAYTVIDVNMRGTLNFIKVAASNMRRNKTRGSIVITASATAYAPEQCFPVYSAAKLAVSSFLLPNFIYEEVLHEYPRLRNR